MISRKPKISIIGTGKVGSAIAFTILIKGLASELVLNDHNPDAAFGEACDLLHATPYANSMCIKSGGMEETANSNIVIITASTSVRVQKSRNEQANANAELFKTIIPEVVKYSPDSILIIISNPVDIMTYLAIKLSGFSPSKVIGTGTTIDSGRFKALLGEYVDVNPQEVHAYILGEHGDSEFAALSTAVIGGCPIDPKSTEVIKAFDDAREGGLIVRNKKGYTNYAIALAAGAIIECIVNDSRKILPVSTLIDGYLGVKDICLSMPVVIGRGGIAKTICLDLSIEEQEKFKQSARELKQIAESLNI